MATATINYRITSKIYLGGGVQSTHRTAAAVCKELKRHSNNVKSAGSGAYHDCRIEGNDGDGWRMMEWDGYRPDTLRFAE